MGSSFLDDPAALSAPGARTMLSLAGATGTQLQEGFDLGRSSPDLPSAEGLRAVALAGMGGSGIAGDIVRALYLDRLGTPIVVLKGQVLPEFCGRDTLVLASSFSGNTEETIAIYTEAVARGCRTVAISSGGELASLSEADLVPYVQLPAEVPMPRAALGYLVGVPLGVLAAMGEIPPVQDSVAEAAGLLNRLANGLGPDASLESNEAKRLATWFEDRTPVVWGSEGLAEAAALRWKTQFNENAKGPAWASVLPELDHNEIEGWSHGRGSGFAAVVLRHPGEHPRFSDRIEATIEAAAPSGLEIRQARAHGDRPLEWLFSLIMLGDYTSIYLAIERSVDPLPIPVLTGLKERLRQ